MKSSNTELEKKIDNIIEEMDFKEVEREPLSKSFDSFLKYANENLFNEHQ